MRNWPIILLFLSFLSCTHEDKTNNEFYSEETVYGKMDTLKIGDQIYNYRTSNDTNTLFKKLNLPDSTDNIFVDNCKEFVTRKADSLFFKCDNGKIIKLVNDRGEDYTVFLFVEYNHDINYYVVNQYQMESQNFILINKITGEPLKAISYPVVSPNANYFVCANSDLEAGFDVNGIEIYRKKNKAYQLAGLREFKDWGPDQLKWKNDTTLIIKGLQRSGEANKFVKVYKEIYFK
ncbi:MAG: hypothetical protein HYX39_13485 [Bacteroidetes bacterium]|nr:hypothetical protein [Bacteroidota bacterium]